MQYKPGYRGLKPTDTICPLKGCTGGLFRTGDGADKLSEHFGRIVLQCDRCGEKWSVKSTKGDAANGNRRTA